MFFIFALHYFHAGLGVNSIRLHYAYKRKIHVSLKKRTGKESLRLPTPRVGHSCVITFNLPLWTSPDHCTFSVWLHFSSTKINSNYFGQNTQSLRESFVLVCQQSVLAILVFGSCVFVCDFWLCLFYLLYLTRIKGTCVFFVSFQFKSIILKHKSHFQKVN